MKSKGGVSAVISHSNKGGLMRKPPETQDYPGKRAGGEHPDEAMSSKRWSTAFYPDGAWIRES
jgi:hypothetical protein